MANKSSEKLIYVTDEGRRTVFDSIGAAYENVGYPVKVEIYKLVDTVTVEQVVTYKTTETKSG
jgi:hypothetical protein